MANNCDDTFKRLQQLEERRRRLASSQADLRRAMASTQRMLDEARLGKAAGIPELDDFQKSLDGQQINDVVERGFEQGRRTEIGNGDPNNYAQLNKRFENVNDRNAYAKVSRQLLETGQQLDPSAWRFVNDSWDNQRISNLFQGMWDDLDQNANEILTMMREDVAPFQGLVERMARLNVAATGLKTGFIESIRKVATHLENSDQAVPNGLKVELLHRFKVALLAERHYDFARRRAGQTLRSLQVDPGTGRPLMAGPDLDQNLSSAFNMPDEAVDATLGLTPRDLFPNSDTSLLARVIKILDEAKTNPKKALKDLENLEIQLDLMGMDPKGKLGAKDWWNDRMKFANLLAKDSQLFNFSTQVKVNAGSNFAMLLMGPARTAFENGHLLSTYGTQLNRNNFWDGIITAWDGVNRASMVTRAAWREVFNTALKKGVHHFAQNQDLIHKVVPEKGLQRADAQFINDLNLLMDEPWQKGRIPGPAGFLTPHNVALARGKLHASLRLWMRDRFGDKMPQLLAPGLRYLSAVDNVAGLFHYSFKVQNDLVMKYRRLGQDVNSPAIRKMIDDEFNRAFYSHAPDEAEIKAFRRQHGIGADKTDSDIAGMIATNKLGETYGAPRLDTDISRGAEAYSEEMRFQNKPDWEPMASAYEAANRARRRWEIDLAFPYFQSPIMGLAMDWAFSGGTTIVDGARMIFGAKLTPHQMARFKANLYISGTLVGMFSMIEAIDDELIIGNGPIGNWQERQEWLADLEARNLKPNSIAGIPLLGGIPVLNTLFLYKDIKDAWFDGIRSEADQQTVMAGILSVLAGQLTRQTSLGQLYQLMEVMQDPTNPFKLRTLQYMAAGQIPGIGLIRTAERTLFASQASDYYQGKPPTWEEQAAGKDLDGIERTQMWLRNLTLNTSGLTGMFGGMKKEQDWLGSPINQPFGVDYAQYLGQRFFPMIWPSGEKDKVYAELDAQNMLSPPRALMEKQLEGVAMSDRLQKLYNDAYGTLKGDTSITARMKIASKSASITVRLPVRVDLPSGATVNADKSISIPLLPLLEKHVKGKTALEAFRSLINDPLYQAMEEAEGLSANFDVQDQAPADRRRKPAQAMLRAVKDYYGLLARDELNRSNDPEAVRWREARRALNAEKIEQYGESLRGLAGAFSGAQ